MEIEINVKEDAIIRINGVKYYIKDWEIYGIFRAEGGF
jgi:hypothetical protein